MNWMIIYANFFIMGIIATVFIMIYILEKNIDLQMDELCIFIVVVVVCIIPQAMFFYFYLN